MKRIFPYILLLLFSIYSCNTTEPPLPPSEPPKAIKLNLIETNCTEAFINITAEDTVLPVNITLDRDNNLLFNLTLTKPDTIIIDETLLPGKTYVYQTRSIINGKEEIGDTLQVRSLDTTSHNFSWQQFTFGDPETAGSSTLNDVAIIDENNIYAVGEIYLNDSTGQPEQLLYNIMHWNGNKWEAKRAQANFRGNIVTVTLDGIFTFSSTDIWLIGSLPIHGDGINWQMYDIRATVEPNLSLLKAWGKNPSEIYFSGRTGALVYYKNGNWRK